MTTRRRNPHPGQIYVQRRFGQRLTELLADSRLSQNRLAKLLDVHSSTITHWKKGRNLPASFELTKKLAAALHADAEELWQLVSFDKAIYELQGLPVSERRKAVLIASLERELEDASGHAIIPEALQFGTALGKGIHQMIQGMKAEGLDVDGVYESLSMTPAQVKLWARGDLYRLLDPSGEGEREMVRRLKEALSRLSAEAKEVIKLRLLQEPTLTVDEIAEVQGVSVETVRERLEQGLDQFGDAWREGETRKEAGVPVPAKALAADRDDEAFRSLREAELTADEAQELQQSKKRITHADEPGEVPSADDLDEEEEEKTA